MRKQLELWAGLEGSLTRVGDSLYDQFAETGHLTRAGDFDRIADLGATTVRYALHWERIAPDGDLFRADWRFTDAQMTRFQERGVAVAATLLHHGSGAIGYTSLLDPHFPAKFAAFARAAAERYPFVTLWTPINEPLTTARFAGLYGFWHPHGRSEQSFARILVNQIKAIVAAMREIRAVIPPAQLLQTEDLGKTYATARMGHQAYFENTRRFLTWDLLCGMVNDDAHRMWGHLLWAGIGASELREFADAPCPPDIIGVDHYLTSERFLDERRERYPTHTWGANESDTYADIEAVRVLGDGLRGGLASLLSEVWRRYALPVAIAEVHLGTEDEAEQARWLADVWQTARHIRQTGADIRAVTAWAAFGAYDWNSLMTRRDRVYERGLWDIERTNADGSPRATLCAEVARALAQTGELPPLPALDIPGWWQTDRRLIYPVVEADELAPDCFNGNAERESRPLFVK
ncbi:MAG: family 1 glycosylhydrolase [Armatimonadetes bacterium]|nr:family 1 glycosylhydrolase [Armatimonadota bacterium]